MKLARSHTLVKFSNYCRHHIVASEIFITILRSFALPRRRIFHREIYIHILHCIEVVFAVATIAFTCIRPQLLLLLLLLLIVSHSCWL